MKCKKSILNKCFSFLATFMLLLQSVTPYFFLSSPVYAQSEEPVVEVAPAEESAPAATENTSEGALESEVPPATETPTEAAAETTESEPTVEVVSTSEVSTTSETSESTVAPEPEGEESAVTGDLSVSTIDSFELNSTDQVYDSSLVVSGTLSTDKADYAPTEQAIITGSDLEPKTTYLLRVSSSDPPAVNHEANVTTDDNGSFMYIYQLDGTYRPNYLVELFDQDENSVSKTTFTDSTVQTNSNAACMQDAPGSPSGLVCTANDVSIASVNNIQVLDDGCQFPGDTVTFTATWDLQSTSTERYDIGLYFATAGQSSAKNGATSCSVSTLANAPVPPWSNLDGDACGDITSAAQVHPQITMTAVCTPDPTTNLLKLPYCTSWDNNAGGVCSTPADAFPATKSKCNCQDGFTVPIIVPEFADIEVIKDLIPSNDTGTFNLQVDGADEASCVGDAGTSGTVAVEAGTNDNPGATHTVGETACQGTDLQNYDTSISCVDRGTTNVVASGNGTGPLNINVDPDDDIVCTITNSVPTGTLTVTKQLSPESDLGLFNLLVDGNTEATNVGDGGTTGALTLDAGDYTVSETAGTATDLNNYVSEIGGDCDLQGNVTVPAGGSAQCTITNTRKTGTLILEKILNPTDDSSLWDMEVTGDNVSENTTLGHSQTDQFTLPTGEYAIVENPDETVVEDIYDSSYSCVSGETVVASGQGRNIDDLAVNYNETVTCTFTNVARGSITGTKYEVESDGSIIGALQGWVIRLFQGDTEVASDTTDENGFFSFTGLVQGVYTLVEDLVAGWTQIFSPTVVTLDPGETDAGNDFGNFENVSVTACKLIDEDGNVQTTDDQTIFFNDGGWPMTLVVDGQDEETRPTSEEDGCYTWENLGPGHTYGVREQSIVGYTHLGSTSQDFGPAESGENYSHTFYNFQNGSISGKKFNDLNGDHVRTNGTTDPNLPGWTIRLDLEGTATPPSCTVGTINGEYCEQVTNGSGNYNFTNLGPGVYIVSEVLQAGWLQTRPNASFGGEGAQADGTYRLTMTSGRIINDRLFGNQGRGSITVNKNVDVNGDGDLDDAEDVLGATDWTWYMGDDGGHSTGSTVDVSAGNYDISEQQKPNYHFSDLQCSGEGNEFQGAFGNVAVDPGEDVTCTYTNTRDTGNVLVSKYHDSNANGIHDEGEDLLSSWTINLGGFNGQTDEDGVITFDVPTGEYTLSEVIQTDWFQSNISCGESGEIDNDNNYPVAVTTRGISCAIGNYQNGNINVTKRVLDPDGEEIVDTTTDFNFVINPEVAEFSLTDDESENTSVLPGQYTVTETPNEDYEFIGCQRVVGEGAVGLTTEPFELQVDSQQTINIECINRQRTGDITVIKRVVGAGGEEVEDSSTEFGFIIDPEVASFGLTDDGEHTEAVNPGTYQVVETPDEDYDFDGCVAEGATTGEATENGREVTLGSNDDVTVTCTNRQQRGRIIVTKYSDVNGNGNRDEGESTLPGWGINLEFDFLEETTDENGEATFDVDPGLYTLTEDPQEGWRWISTQCSSDIRFIQLDGPVNGIENFHRVRVNSGDEVTCEIGNQPTDPELTIEKSNNTGGAVLSAGDTVLYTLIVTASESAGLAEDVEVVDVSPEGFAYQGGSWTASSSVRGDLKTGGTTTEPTYASPGTWQLGDMIPGEVVTLTYLANIDSTQDSGIYPDLAWAQGESVGGSDILASAGTTGNIGEENFVGTQVEIASSIKSRELIRVEKKVEKQGEVLAAETSLPATGAYTVWTILALSLMGFGALSLLFGLSLRSKKLTAYIKKAGKHFLVIAGLLIITGLISQVHAADVSVRIEDPASTGVSSFSVNWVTLDIQNRTMTVRCFQQGPGDAGFAQFGGDIATPAGGDNGTCSVDSSIVNTNGTYQFFVTATPSGGAPVQSATVTADVNTNGPGTPSQFSKTRLNACQYRIAFRTADDGQTVKVEIYRSEGTSFVVEDDTRITTIAALPNQEVIYTDNAPDCNKFYYYAARAFNASGVASGVVGDSVEIVTTTGTTTTTSTTTQAGAIPVGSSNIGGEEVVTGETGTTGEGTAPEEGATQGEETAQTGEESTGTEEVLGLQTDQGIGGFIKSIFANQPLTALLALILLGVTIYVIYYQRRK